ncbi:CidA/LrgA family protein [Rossellomorea aquimaris]|uniref:CidA/LrgA family protein n=1 Tax=Rossellomorea aquimaris TaxID=189382 RepID=UPI0007D05CC2|nr:CidA/LrgA family protein [Rossellomorea aquimaris]
MAFIRITVQIVILCFFYEIGKWCADFFQLPIPGSIIGMLLLFVLLQTGVVKERLFLEGASFFLKHFSFFFLPLSVSVMVLGPYILQYGWKLLIIIIISALGGFTATSLSAQGLINLKENKSHDPSH